MHQNVFQFRAPDIATTIASKGDRIPAVFQAKYSNRLLTRNFISGETHYFDVDAKTNEWFNLKFVQER